MVRISQVVVPILSALLTTAVSAGALVVDAEDHILGMLIGDYGYGSTGAYFTVINDNGYKVRCYDYYENPANTAILYSGNFVYQTLDCTGTPYLESRADFGGTVINGPVGVDPEPLGLWMTLREERPELRKFLTRRVLGNNWLCEPHYNPSDAQPSVRVYANNPEISGVSKLEWPSPLRIVHPLDPNLSGCIFQDRFERCQ